MYNTKWSRACHPTSVKFVAVREDEKFLTKLKKLAKRIDVIRPSPHSQKVLPLKTAHLAGAARRFCRRRCRSRWRRLAGPGETSAGGSRRYESSTGERPRWWAAARAGL